MSTLRSHTALPLSHLMVEPTSGMSAREAARASSYQAEQVQATSDIKAQLALLRAYIADQHTEQNLLNTRLATAEIKIDRIERRLSLRDE
jgi:hypothetical protein